MITGHVFIATSVDGFIARKNDNLDWLLAYSVDGEDYGYGDMMASVDGLIMGRGTYQQVLTFGDWPYTKPVVVMSQSLTSEDIPENLRSKVRITSLSPKALMEKLNNKGWRRAYIDGGKVVQSFLNDGLIEDMIITRAPVLIGGGVPLFGMVSSDIKLELLETHAYSSGMAQLKYRVIERE